MRITGWANLGMGLAGAVGALASNSQALMIDGLFSLIGYISAVYAMRISRTTQLGPDRQRPFGHASDEVLYATFRSLALIGLVVFGVVQSILGISDYILTGDVEEIQLFPVAVYTVIVVLCSFYLAEVHRRAWVKTGRTSDMLHLEMEASVYDGVLTLVAGIGLLSTPFVARTFLAPLAPVMDSIIVLLLCGFAVFGYLRAFQRSIAQLAGKSAERDIEEAVARIVRPILEAGGGEMVDLALVKIGRKLDAVVYFRPEYEVSPGAVDVLRDRITEAVASSIGAIQVLVVVSNHGRDEGKQQ